MESAKPFDDEGVRILLMGIDSEISQALSIINSELQRPMCGAVRGRLRSLRPEDLADTWQDALHDVLRNVRRGSFDPDKPFMPWFSKILWARAIDHLRGKTRYDKLRERYAERLLGTNVGERLAALDPGKRDEVWAIIQQTVAQLPLRQRLVFQVFLAGLPETEQMEHLRKAVSGSTGVEETLASVKRALQEARSKAWDALAQHGLTF